MLKLRIVQAKEGDCLVLVYGTDPQNAHYMLIDGGPGGIFSPYLAPELKRIQAANGQIDQVVLSHIDNDHAIGLLNYFATLQESAGSGKWLLPRELWHNTFSQMVAPQRAAQVAEAMVEDMAGSRDLEWEPDTFLMDLDPGARGLAEGDRLTRMADALNIPVNPGLPPLEPELGPQGFMCAETAKKALAFDGITLRVAGPTRKNLQRLRKEWDEWLGSRGERGLDTSYANLSSLMFLVKSKDGKRILFTGDGRPDEVVAALKRARAISSRTGKLKVDVLKLPHHGSIRNATPEFFQTVIAKHYVISANGKHDNPDINTLRVLTDIRKADGEPYYIWITNETPSTCDFRKERPPSDEYCYRFVQLPYDTPAAEQVLEIDLDLPDPAASYPPLPGPYTPVSR